MSDILLDLKYSLINYNHIEWELLDINILKKIIINYNHIKVIRNYERDKFCNRLQNISIDVAYLLFILLIVFLLFYFIK